jgi:hypothetical protein
MDVQIIPNSDFSQINLRVHRMIQPVEDNSKDKVTAKTLNVMQEVCKYL